MFCLHLVCKYSLYVITQLIKRNGSIIDLSTSVVCWELSLSVWVLSWRKKWPSNNRHMYVGKDKRNDNKIANSITDTHVYRVEIEKWMTYTIVIYLENRTRNKDRRRDASQLVITNIYVRLIIFKLILFRKTSITQKL